jgi:hypothetical protein
MPTLVHRGGACHRLKAASWVAISLVLPLLATGCGPESYLPNTGGDDGGAGSSGGLGGAGGGAAPVDAAGDGTGNLVDGSADGPASVIHYDFESTLNLDNWQPVGSQRPSDVQDNVQVSTVAHHHGDSALAMIFDGTYTPLPSGQTAYYGVYTAFNPPPPGAVVTMWMMSTLGGVSAQIYTQTMPDYLWQGLQVTPAFVANTWTKITVTMPSAEAFYLGCLINSPLDMSGSIFLDDISW